MRTEAEEADRAFEAATGPLFERLAALGIETRTVRHQAVFTVEESVDLRGAIPGAHTKNLFLKDKKGRHFLLVAEESREIELKSLHGRIGARGRLSFAGAEAMRAVLGVEPGSVTAFAVLNDRDGEATLVLDEALLSHDIVNAHPMTNTATTSIASRDLLTFLRACGHDPLVVDLDAAKEDGPVS